MDLYHTNTFYQYLADFLLNSIMHLFFQILNLLLLVLSMDDLEYMTTFYMIMRSFIFICVIIKINHLCFTLDTLYSFIIINALQNLIDLSCTRFLIFIAFSKKVSHYHHFTFTHFKYICYVWMSCNSIKFLQYLIIITT